MANIQGRVGVDGQMDTTVNSHYCRGLSIDFFYRDLRSLFQVISNCSHMCVGSSFLEGLQILVSLYNGWQVIHTETIQKGRCYNIQTY